MMKAIKGMAIIVICTMVCTLCGCGYNSNENNKVGDTLFDYTIPDEHDYRHNIKVLDSAYYNNSCTQEFAALYMDYFKCVTKILNSIIEDRYKHMISDYSDYYKIIDYAQIIINKEIKEKDDINICDKMKEEISSVTEWIENHKQTKLNGDIMRELRSRILIAHILLTEPDKYDHAIEMNP